jgi:shikimate kinase
LQAPFALCWSRIKAFVEERPLAPNEAAALALFNQRLASYALADLHIEANEDKSADALAHEILRAIGLHKSEKHGQDDRF